MKPISDEQLDKLGQYYTSDYVAKNQPWIKEIPFAEWVERELLKGGEGDAKQSAYEELPEFTAAEKYS